MGIYPLLTAIEKQSFRSTKSTHYINVMCICMGLKTSWAEYN